MNSRSGVYPFFSFCPAEPRRASCQWRGAAGPSMLISAQARIRCLSSRVLLARIHSRRDRMAHSRPVRVGVVFGMVAWRRTDLLFCGRSTVLVACSSAMAQRDDLAPMDGSLVSFPCHLALRRTFSIPYFLWPRCVSKLSELTSGVLDLTSPRSRMRRSADVGLGDVCLPRPGSGCYNPDTFAN